MQSLFTSRPLHSIHARLCIWCAAGLGFEDCSAELERVGQVEHSKPWQKQLVAEDGKSWRFFSFEVAPDDYQVNIHVDREDEQSANGCESGFALAGQALPTPCHKFMPVSRLPRARQWTGFAIAVETPASSKLFGAVHMFPFRTLGVSLDCMCEPLKMFERLLIAIRLTIAG